MSYVIYLLLIGLMAGAYWLAERSKKKSAWVWLPLGILALVTAEHLFSVSAPSKLFKDFLKSYYPAGELVWADPSELYRKTVGGFVNIPILATPFTPISLMRPEAACAVMTLLSAAALAASVLGLFRLGDVQGRGRIVIVCMFLVNGPLYYSLREGNLTHVVFPLLILALARLRSGRDIGAGLVLALSGIVKIPLLLMIVYLVVRKRWKALFAASAFLVALVGTSVLMFGRALHGVWFDRMVLRYLGRPVGAYNVESLDGFLARLFRPNNLLNWSPLDMGPVFSVLRWSGRLLLLGAVAYVFMRSGPPRTNSMIHSEYCIVLLLALLISPISWTHYYLFLLLPLSLAVAGALPPSQGRLDRILFAVGAVLVSLPNTPMTLPRWVGRGQISNMLVSRFFFGGVILFGVLLFRHARAASARDLDAPSKRTLPSAAMIAAPAVKDGSSSRRPVMALVIAAACSSL